MPVDTLHLSQTSLTPEQCQTIMALLAPGNPVRSFDIQRELFHGALNQYARAAIKSYLKALEKSGKIIREGVKRGTTYRLTPEE